MAALRIVCARPPTLPGPCGPTRTVWLPLLLLLGACQPVVLNVGALPDGRAGEEGGLSEPSDAGAPAMDAGVSPQDGGPAWDGRGPGVDGGIPSREDASAMPCIDMAALLDDPELDARLRVQTLEQLGCEPMLNEPIGNQVLARVDGQPLLRSGEAYSVRWSSTPLTSLALFGGDVPCEREVLFSEPVVVALGSRGCRDFVPEVDVPYFSLLAGYVLQGSLEVCFAPCSAR